METVNLTFEQQVILYILGPSIGLLGMVLTVILMNKQNRKQLESANENHQKELELRTKMMQIERDSLKLDREIAVGQVILPKCIEVMQRAFKHTMTINYLLNTASMAIDIEEAAGQPVELIKQGQKLNQAVQDIRDWYDENCFYLPIALQEEFVGLLNQLHVHFFHLSADREIEVRDITWKRFFNVSESLKDSIKNFMFQYSIIENAFGETNKADTPPQS